MNVSKKLFLVGALLCSAFVSRSQSYLMPISPKDLPNDACGKNVTLPFSMPTLNLETEFQSLRKLSCTYAMGPLFPQEIADEMKSIIEEATGLKPLKNLRCDFLQPLSFKALFSEKEQQSLDELIKETFHR